MSAIVDGQLGPGCGQHFIMGIEDLSPLRLEPLETFPTGLA